MNWKNVLRLYGVYNKSYRLIVRDKFRNYRESRWKKPFSYLLLLLLGAAFGLLMAYGIGTIWSGTSPGDQRSIQDAAASIFVAIPVIVMLYSLYFTQMSQIQRLGANVAVQPIYWFPITREEHTLASILTSMGTPLALTLLVLPAILIPSYVIGLLPLGVLTIVALFTGMGMTGATSEILRGIQARIVGTLSKRAGRLTVWVRFLATLVLFTLIYVFYFSLNRADVIGLAQSLADGIMLAWFVPYLWPGIVLYEAYRGAWAEAALFMAGVVGFSWVLYRLAVRSNERFALQDSQVIRISGGPYMPKRGLLEKLGVSAPVAAVMRKDLKAYTRRQELMYVFVMPIVFVVSMLMPIVAGSGSQGLDTFSFFFLSLEPAVVLVIFLASSAVGSEGERRWFLFMSPLSPRSFVRAKYLFCTLIGTVVALASVAVASLIFAPTPGMIVTGVIESLLLTFSVGVVALAFGIAGADFREAPRQRTIRPRWMMACIAVSFALSLVVVLPVLAYGTADMVSGLAPGLLPSPLPHAYLFAAWAISGCLALVIGYLFYLLSVRSALNLFKSADT